MAKKWLVLRPNGPKRLGNANFQIKQGEVAVHPGYPVDNAVLEEFDNYDAAWRRANENAELFNDKTKEGITSRKTLEANKARNAKDPSAADKQRALDNAKVLDKAKDGGIIVSDPRARERELEAQLAAERKKNKASPDAFLDQNKDTVTKKVKSAIKKGELAKEDVQEIIKAEEQGKARVGVLKKLTSLVKDDALFGRLFKK